MNKFVKEEKLSAVFSSLDYITFGIIINRVVITNFLISYVLLRGKVSFPTNGEKRVFSTQKLFIRGAVVEKGEIRFDPEYFTYLLFHKIKKKQGLFFTIFNRFQTILNA